MYRTDGRDAANLRTKGLTLGPMLERYAAAFARCGGRAQTLVLFALAHGALGCATILSGSSQEVNFRATARAAATQGTLAVSQTDVHATVDVRDGSETVARGTTPFRTALARKHSYTAVIRAPGFEEVSVALDRRFNLWMLGNLACGGLVGGVVDWLTGAMWRLSPDEVAVELARVAPTPVVDGQASDVEASPSTWVAVFTALDARGELRTLSVPLRPRP